MNERASLLTVDGLVDIELRSEGRFPADVTALYDRWNEFVEWGNRFTPAQEGELPDRHAIGSPVPAPRQIFAIGLNYVDHTAESGFVAPDEPVVFTKFASSVSGPFGSVVLPTSTVDWEVELVAVIGAKAHNVSADDAWNYIAGLTVGQDYSERTLQLAGNPPQFSLGKSFPGFAPIGPVLVTTDEFENVSNLLLECSIDGEIVQSARVSDMVFPIPRLVEYLSSVCTLLPGDLIFTGTPAGVGMGRNPQRFLSAGQVIRTRIEGIGEMIQTCVAQSPTEAS